MKVGELVEYALWYNGSEQRAKAEMGIARYFSQDEEHYGVVFGPIKFTDIDPNDQRLGDNAPPELGAKVLLGEAECIALQPMSAGEAGFIANLEPADLEKLRCATRRAFKKENPKSTITQDQIDMIITKMAPETVRRMVH